MNVGWNGYFSTSNKFQNGWTWIKLCQNDSCKPHLRLKIFQNVDCLREEIGPAVKR